MPIDDILKYWMLCELSNFETFKIPNEKIKDYSFSRYLNTNTFNNQESFISKQISSEYIYNKNISNRKSINIEKTTNIYKMFLGIIRIEDFIKFLCKSMNNDNLQKFENELDTLNMEEYVYIGYIYLDYLGNIISIENKSIFINPIFYILKNINLKTKLNNIDYNASVEELNESFSRAYSLNTLSYDLIIPSFYYLMETMNPKINSNPFKFLEYKNCKIIIYLELYNKLKYDAHNEINNDYKNKAMIYYTYLNKLFTDEITNENIIFFESNVKFSNIEQYVLDSSIQLALDNSISSLYYLVNLNNRPDETIRIPINMYLYEFIKEEYIYELNLMKSDFKTKIDFYDIQNIILNIFDIPNHLLLTDKETNNSIFFGLQHKQIILKNVKNIIDNSMISFYIDSLSEKPKRLTIDYIKGKDFRLDVNESISNRKKINDLKFFKLTQGKWISRHPLYYAQQCAVNLFISNYNNKGNIFSVNGAPGTGKTTLLKDVIANIVIKKIQKIIDLNFDIFRNNMLNDDLIGKFEIIVTSNNNTAVENITIELPKLKEFDFEYIGCDKNSLLLSEFANIFYEFDSWGLFSISLGKKSNMDIFRNKFNSIVEKIKQSNKSLLNDNFLEEKLSKLVTQFLDIKKDLIKDENEFEFNYTNQINNSEYFVSNDDYFNLPESLIQKDNQLYGKDRYLKNKSLLFFVSIQISEVIFLKYINNFTLSINGYLDNYTRKDLLSKDLENLQKNFSSLFFIFPVVSTTLASSYTMLKDIESFGTLICDESGQATPQSLVGVLNRANNALIVGDPLQVEPVITVPEIIINMYNETFNISDLYSPLVSSAQRVSDNANIFGSYYEIQNKKIWVGMPLVVHRRCLDPMFTISNKISYNNKMVLATTYKTDYIEDLPDSCWIDIVSDEYDYVSNSSKKEIEAIIEFVNKHKNILENNYYIISPFKSINRMFNNDSKIEKNNNFFGTVHTFQGKESDVVFIALGGKTKGARKWASLKPNILNVALTRAKKKVYIIGDYKEWSKLNFFDEASKELKRYETFPNIDKEPINEIITTKVDIKNIKAISFTINEESLFDINIDLTSEEFNDMTIKDLKSLIIDIKSNNNINNMSINTNFK